MIEGTFRNELQVGKLCRQSPFYPVHSMGGGNTLISDYDWSVFDEVSYPYLLFCCPACRDLGPLAGCESLTPPDDTGSSAPAPNTEVVHNKGNPTQQFLIAVLLKREWYPESPS